MKGSGVLSVGARLSKLRAMSKDEVAHRLWYKAVLAHERRQHRAGTLAPADRLRRALVRDVRQDDNWQRALLARRRASPHRYLPSVGARPAMRALFGSRYATELDATRAHAAEARAHRFAFFGGEYRFGPEIPWQHDPVTGAAWPQVFHADVPVHGGNVGFGDVKHVWELSRLQFLMDLAKSWFLTDSREDLDAMVTLVRSWIAGNPYATGVNWSCALEPAFRIFSWLWAYHLTADALNDDDHLAWLESFYDHARFIERHLEHYSSPYNHLIAEASALYMAGACFPEFEASARWRSVGTSVMTRRLPEQFYPDGGSVEQSTFYHHATVGFYLLAGLTARASGDDLAPEIWAAIERGLGFSLALTQPDGFTPTIGGADDGKPIRMEQLPFWDFRPYLAVGAVVFNRPELKAVAGRFHEDALWLLGPDGLRAFEEMPAVPPSSASMALRDSGYFVLRSDWSPSASYVCVDCGEQAAGMRTDAVPNSMHGHADCLSLVAWLGGTRTLVDSGLYAYNCGGEWEAHFRETAAHNTARVDGRDQARHIRKMAWSHSYRATQEGWAPEAGGGWIVGSHDGFARGPEGVRHRRTVWLRPEGYLLVADEFEGAGTHDLEVTYQFAPGVLDLVGQTRARFDGVVEAAWIGSEPWDARTACGGEHPGDGWIAPSLGIRVPAPRVTLTCRSGAPRTWLLTVLAHAPHGASRIRRVDLPDARLLAVTVADGLEVVASRGSAPFAATDSEATVLVCRVPSDTGGPIHVARAGGGAAADVDAGALRRLLATHDHTSETSR